MISKMNALHRLKVYLQNARDLPFDPKIISKYSYLCYIRMAVIFACQKCDIEVLKLFYNFAEFYFTSYMNKKSQLGSFNCLSNELIGNIFSFSQNANMFTETGEDIGMTFVSGNIYLNIVNRNTKSNNASNNASKILEIFKYLKNICKLHILYKHNSADKYEKYRGVLIIEQAIYIGHQELLNYIILIYNQEIEEFDLQNTYPQGFDKSKSNIDLESFDLDNIINYLYK